MKILQKCTRTISVSFVVWPLENLENPITTVIRKLKNYLNNIVNISRSPQMNLKVLNWKIFIPWKILRSTTVWHEFERRWKYSDYLSQTSFQIKIYMNVFEHHLSFITDPMMYSKSYVCNRCGKVSTKMPDNNCH